MTPADGLAEGEARVWWAHTGRDLVGDGGDGLMSDEERDRARAMTRPQARRRFVLGCALMRLAVARHLGLAPTDVRIERRCPDCGGPHGRPWLPGQTGLHLSLSHAGPHVVCAVARGAPIGVDVEDGAGLVDAGSLAEKVLAPVEIAAYRRLPPDRRPEALLVYWTRKEAVLKATGDGLRVPMRTLAVSGPYAEPRVLGWAPGDRPGPITRDDRSGLITRGDRPGPIALHTLRGPGGGRVCPPAALAVLGRPLSTLIERDAGPLFDSVTHSSSGA